MCNGTYSGNNTRYVAFLNKLTSILKNSLLGEQSIKYNISLHTVNSLAGDYIQEGGNFQCDCQMNYRIMINRNLEALVNNVSQTPNVDEKINYFVAFTILLKFHPKSCWLVDKYKIRSGKFQYEDSDAGISLPSSSSTDERNTGYSVADIENKLTQNEDVVLDGCINDKGSYLRDGEKLFDILYKYGVEIARNMQKLKTAQLYKEALIEIFRMFCKTFGVVAVSSVIDKVFKPRF